LAGDNPASETTNSENDSDITREVEETCLHRMAKVHIILEIWQRSQSLHAIQKEFYSPDKQGIAVGYISDSEVVIKISCPLSPPHGGGTYKMSERSSLPSAFPSKDLPGR
jgi:hypothetical protein